MNKLSKVLSLLFSSALVSSYVYAQCTVNGKEIPCDQFWRDYGLIFGLMGIVLVALAAFWIWMLVDCLKSDRSDKLVWTLVLLFGNFIGAILYFFIAKNKG